MQLNGVLNQLNRIKQIMAGRGRPKGSQGKNTSALLLAIQRTFPNYNPILEMAKLANDPEASAAERFNANREVAQYIAPKLKSVEVKADVNVKADTKWQVEFINADVEDNLTISVDPVNDIKQIN